MTLPPLPAPRSGHIHLDGGRYEVCEPIVVTRGLVIVGPGTLAITTLGPAFLVQRSLSLMDVTVERGGGSGGLLFVAKGGKLTLKGGSLRGATACEGYPAGVDAQGPALENHGELIASGLSFEGNAFASLVASDRSHSALADCRLAGEQTFTIDLRDHADLALLNAAIGPGGDRRTAIHLSGAGHAMLTDVRITGPGCAISAHDASRVALADTTITGHTESALSTYGTAEATVEGCTLAASPGWGISTHGASSVDVASSTIHDHDGIGVDADGRSRVTLGPGTTIERVGPVCAIARGTATLALRGARLVGSDHVVEVTELGTIDEEGSELVGPEPRCAFVLGQWCGNVPSGPFVEVDGVLRYLWDVLGAAHPDIADRRAVLELLPARVAWGWANDTVPAPIVAVLRIIAEEPSLATGGRVVLDAACRRPGADPAAHAEIRRIRGRDDPLSPVDWRRESMLSLARPATAIAVDAHQHVFFGDESGRVLRDGAVWAAVDAAVVAIRVSQDEPVTVGVDVADGFAWLDTAGKILLRMRNTGDNSYFGAEPVTGGLTYLDQGESGHPTDRATRTMQVSSGPSGLTHTESDIRQGPADLPAPAHRFTDGTHLTPDWGRVILHAVDGTELARWPGDPVRTLAVSPGPNRRVWLVFDDGTCAHVAIVDQLATPS